MIITNNEEAIKLKCEDVKEDEVGELISLLDRELEESERLGRPGIGLAAPQLGIAKKIAIVRLSKYNGPDINLINCRISKYYDPFVFKEEGCLSFPGRIESTNRFQEVYVEDNLSDIKSFVVSGLPAVVCQHEIDHWNQKVFYEYKIKEVKQKIGPNSPCICGKPVKYKKCCGKNIKG